MKIFFTAEYDPRELEPLYPMAEIVIDGWAKGLPTMGEAELMEKTADADIIVTTFDDITRAVIENAKNLKLIACTRATPVNIDITAAKPAGLFYAFQHISDSLFYLFKAVRSCFSDDHVIRFLTYGRSNLTAGKLNQLPCPTAAHRFKSAGQHEGFAGIGCTTLNDILFHIHAVIL